MNNLPYNQKLNEYARMLRNNMTKEEKHLWYDYLSRSSIRWMRQRIVDNYIVDFYCATAKLVIELDGSHHYTDDGISYDKIRTEILKQYGLRVIRFTNFDILNNFEGVCDSINNEIKERTLKKSPL